jgi:hypothetical protein
MTLTMDTTAAIPEAPQLDRRRREMHPEYILVGGETFERNDATARRYGVSERTVNRGDREGAPYAFVGAVKYRPKERYDAHILSRIVESRPESQRGRRRARR